MSWKLNVFWGSLLLRTENGNSWRRDQSQSKKKKKNLNTKVSAYETVANLSRKHWQQWIELQDALQWELRFSLVPLLLKPVWKRTEVYWPIQIREKSVSCKNASLWAQGLGKQDLHLPVPWNLPGSTACTCVQPTTLQDPVACLCPATGSWRLYKVESIIMLRKAKQFK